jgi:hypothetical protein
MKNLIVAGMVILLLTAGCATMMSFEEKEKTYGKEGPVITETFASKQMRPGDTWKIYLNASDPGGDIYRVVAMVNQPGFGLYPASLTKIREGNGKELSGYIYLNTSGPYGSDWQNFLSLSVTVQIQDRAGHFSEPVSFPLSFQSRYTQEPPPPGKFKEQNLGPIMVVLQDPATGGQSSSFF